MTQALPTIIQGGMGIAVSDWRLARAVSSAGQMGVVSGTAIDAVLVRRLQSGDPGGHIRSALEALPFPGMADRILDEYFVEGGATGDSPFARSPMPQVRPSAKATDLLVAANFVEVHLAKQGHSFPVGINFLEKIQLPTLPSLFGAIAAGVDYVLMGAGIPRAIPGVIDRLSAGERAELRFEVKGASDAGSHVTAFDPSDLLDGAPPLKKPAFLAIVASNVLATMMARLDRPADGFIVEGPTAGGHNAPPRGKAVLSEDGQPTYGERDVVDLEAIAQLGLPFWVAGGKATAEGLREVLSTGAAGIQVGTAFAFCTESGLDSELRRQVLAEVARGGVNVFTDPIASPTGFPFKIVRAGEETFGEPEEQRKRVCDLGYLRSAYQKESGGIGWRCPAEPVDDYVRKGGDIADTVGRRCLCNALMANIGLGQKRADGRAEHPILTAGDDLVAVDRFLRDGATEYTAADVIAALLDSESG